MIKISWVVAGLLLSLVALGLSIPTANFLGGLFGGVRPWMFCAAFGFVIAVLVIGVLLLDLSRGGR